MAYFGHGLKALFYKGFSEVKFESIIKKKDFQFLKIISEIKKTFFS